jgi:hypothetical protein
VWDLPRRKVYSRRSAATARRDFRNMTVTNVELLKLGLRIRASRKVLGWTQKRFSRNCGLDRSYFGGVERGKRNMTFSVLCQICDDLSCDSLAKFNGLTLYSRESKCRSTHSCGMGSSRSRGSGKIRCHKIGPRLGNVRLPCNSATAFIFEHRMLSKSATYDDTIREL